MERFKDKDLVMINSKSPFYGRSADNPTDKIGVVRNFRNYTNIEVYWHHFFNYYEEKDLIKIIKVVPHDL